MIRQINEFDELWMCACRQREREREIYVYVMQVRKERLMSLRANERDWLRSKLAFSLGNDGDVLIAFYIWRHRFT